MENIEKNTGELTKDFIKKILNRESELESEIFELQEKIKSLECNGNNDAPKGYDIFIKMIRYASLSWSANDTCASQMPTISIDSCPLAPDEVEYIKKLLVENELYNCFNNAKNVRSTYYDNRNFLSNHVFFGKTWY